MKAVVLKRYGPPEVLQIADLPQPEAGQGQVLIRVHAAAVNPIDWRIRSGSLRFVLWGRFPLVIGYDVSGEVVQCGGTGRFQPKDEVFCFLDGRFGGGYAEYAVASQSVVVPKPAGTSHAEAAALPLAACTALQALRDLGKITPGAEVLINGASGGVGTFAVQLAKAMGAEVTAVCSSRNLQLVSQLGADRAIDYTAEDFTSQKRQYDIILDAVAKSSYWSCRRILKPRGRFITTLPTPNNYLCQVLTRLSGRRSGVVLVRRSGDDLRLIKELTETGRLRAVIDRVLPLDQAAEAHRISQEGHARGKLVLRLIDQEAA